MNASDLRPRPFCANDKLTVVYSNSGRMKFVKCDECGAMGPRAMNTEPPEHAESMWNLRFGAGIEH